MDISFERDSPQSSSLATEKSSKWRRKAELAVQKGRDDLARAALECALSHDRLVAGFTAQAEDQKTGANSLRKALRKLDQKLNEARAHCEMLVAEHSNDREPECWVRKVFVSPRLGIASNRQLSLRRDNVAPRGDLTLR